MLILCLTFLQNLTILSEPHRKTGFIHPAEQLRFSSDLDQRMQTNEQSHRNQGRIFLFEGRNYFGFEHLCDLFLKTPTRLHEIFEGLKALDTEIVEFDDRQFGQDGKHNTLELLMIINKKN